MIQKFRKAGIALAGLLAQAVAAGLVPAKYEGLAAAVLAALTALGVYAVPNATNTPEAEPEPEPSAYVPEHAADATP